MPSLHVPSMFVLRLLAVLAAALGLLGLSQAGSTVIAGQAAPSPALPVSGRVYVANEVSAAISVFDTVTNQLINTVCLGSDPQDDLADTPGATLKANGSPCDGEVDHHKPFYDGHIGTHGLWLTPDFSMLIATNRLSGTVVAIDTAATVSSCAVPGCPNAILGYWPVGREPHLATVRPCRPLASCLPGPQQVWVAVRGERYLDVLDLDKTHWPSPDPVTGRNPARMPRVTTVDTVLGPSMVSFSDDGHYAFVAAGKDTQVQKLDATTNPPALVASGTLSSLFTPFGLVSPRWLTAPDDDQGNDFQKLYLVQKTAGKLSILNTTDLSAVVPDLTIGPCANHVAFVGRLAYITIGGAPPCAPGGTDREGGVVVVDRATYAVVAAAPALAPQVLGLPSLACPQPAPYYCPTVQASASGWRGWFGDPHGIWASPAQNQQRLYVGHERPDSACSPSPAGCGNRVTVINTWDANNPFDDTVEATLMDPAFLKQPIDVVFKPLP